MSTQADRSSPDAATQSSKDQARAGLRRACLALGLAAAAWSCAISMAGGFVLHVGPAVVSSRNPKNPLLLAFIAAGTAFLLTSAGSRRSAFAADRRWLRGLVPRPIAAAWERTGRLAGRLLAAVPGSPSASAVTAFLLSVAVVAFALGKGTLTAGGSDSYGYVSYAHLWATGTLRVDAPLMDDLSDAGLAAAVSPAALVPLAYTLRPDRTLAPTYSPGLPMLMGLFERLGGRGAVFLVVPLLAGLAVWATYLLGRRLAGPTAGLWAAVLLAASPIFIHQLTGGPMSDIPAMACWALVMVLLSSPSRLGATGAGLTAGAAILVRPNLVPLALVPGAALLWEAARERRIGGIAIQRVVLFGIAAMPACLTLAWLNAYWFGSPLLSGYGPLANYFSWSYLPLNLPRYLQWLLYSQTPVVALALAAPFLLRRRAEPAGRAPAWLAPSCLAFAVMSFACYAFYTPYEAWWTLRFVLPGFPALLGLTAATLAVIAARAPEGWRSLPSVIVIAVVLQGLATARNEFAFNADSEKKYAAVATWVDAHLPARAVFFAMQHSGSIRYYAGRASIRWDAVSPASLDAAVLALRRLGYRPYLLLDQWEEAPFRSLHQDADVTKALDRPPLAIVDPGSVRIYELPGGPDRISRSATDQ